MSEKITFRELVQLIAEQSQQSQSSTNSFISELVKVIEGGLRETGSVSISGFGKFELRWMKERTGTHPQTGEAITIPGQNKVYFKSFKALREDVNRPYAGMEARILEEVDGKSETKSESEKDTRTETKPVVPPPGKKDKKTAEPAAPEEKKKATEDKTSDKAEVPIPLGPPEEPEEEDNGDHLLIERSVPNSIEEEEDEGVIYSPDRSGEVIPESLFSISEPMEPEATEEPEEPVKPETSPEPIPVSTASPFKQEQTVKTEKKVEKKSGFNWTYVAAAIIVILAIAALFYFLQQPEEAETPQLTTQQQQEQVLDSDPAQEQEIEEPAGTDAETAPEAESQDQDQSQTGADVEPGADGESAFETSPYTVNRGESLWSISEIRMSNPYFWPVIYNLNSGLTNNPNLIPANAELSVPSISDPENLTPSQLEEVAHGYLSVYHWAAEHQPENARYFLWAVGVFSADVLTDARNRVDPNDWQFAVRR